MTVLAIARNTFREAVRDRIFALVAAFGLLLLCGAIVVSPLTVGAQQKMVADFGLASMSVFAVLVVLFVGTGMVHKEIDKRTIVTLLSKPISRFEYLLGKYLGLMLTILAMMALMGLLFAVALWATASPFKAAYLTSIALSICEMVVLTAVVVFFSTFTTPVLTALFTLGTVVAGRLLPDLEAFAIVTGSHAVERATDILGKILPNFDLYDVRNAAVHDLPIESGHVLWAVVYMVLYSGTLLVFSELVFRHREFR